MGYICKLTQHLLTTNDRYTHSQVSGLIYSRWQKECRTTKEKMEEPTPMKTEQAYIPDGKKNVGQPRKKWRNQHP